MVYKVSVGGMVVFIGGGSLHAEFAGVVAAQLRLLEGALASHVVSGRVYPAYEGAAGLGVHRNVFSTGWGRLEG